MQSGYCGAFLWKADFLSPDELNAAAALAEDLSATRRQMMDPAAGRSDLKWFGADLGADTHIARKVFAELGVEPELLSFYYLEPGARLHPHRDLTGASLNDRIRFHVPIATNPGAEFMAGGQKVEMKPGEMWCVDTSYAHSAANAGSESRVHLVIESGIPEAVHAAMPQGVRAHLHSLAFALYLAGKFAQALAINSVRSPRYFAAQMRMVRHFLAWRLFGRPYA